MSLSTDPAPEPLDSVETPESQDSPEGREASSPEREEETIEAKESASLPIPVGPLRSQLTLPKDDGKRPSLWKRLRMRGRNAETGTTGEATGVAPRLDVIDQRLGQLEATLQEQFEALNGRFEDVWESEEQLSHLADIQDKLDRLSQSHAQLTASISSLRRSVFGLAVLVIIAAAASGLIYSDLL